MDSKLEFMVDNLDGNLSSSGLYGGGFVMDFRQKPCDLEIWAPWYREDDCGPRQHDTHIHENEAFTMFAMECEGDLLTRKGKINKVIKLMVAAGPVMCNDFATQCEIYNQVGIDSDTFTDEEIEYIVGEVAKRL